PNLVPLGYAISADLADGIEGQTGIAVSAKSDYLDEIVTSIESKGDGKISGITTTLNYPNWTSHKRFAEFVRERTGKNNFFVIPGDCVDSDGQIDIDKLNQFNRTFNIPEVDASASKVPGVIIRYNREQLAFNEETTVVNAPGIRMIETQLWGGLFALPGFKELA